ncbi:MAG: serine/threonine-protein kinase, partial [Planctomycetota bacterium]
MELGPYEILEEIGAGGMGVVCRARHRELGHEVALKMIAAGEESGPELAERFRREAQAAGALAGTPGIVGVRDTGIDAATGTLWLAMDFVSGQSLEAIARSGELDHRRAAELMAAVAGAVAAAHAKGFIHRDIKPGNVLVDHAGTAWVTDFGLVRTERAGPEVARLTRSGEIVGTPAYMAPEQVMGGAIDARTDVYGLGATLYELLTGSAPFTGDSMLQVLQSTLRDPPPMAPLRSAGVPDPLQRVVACALAKDPARRYRGAAALAEDLRSWLRGAPVAAQQPAATSRPAPLVAAVAVVLAAGAGGAWWWWGGAPPDTPTPPPADLAGVKAERRAAELAAARFHAYLAVDQACGKPLATLQARWFGAPVAAEAVAAAQRSVDAAIETAGPDAEPHGKAWRAMAAYFGGDRQALSALRAAADAAGPDPFPRLIKARVLLARYLGAVGLPGVSRTALPSAVEFAESDEAKQLRLEFDFALRSLRKAEWWSLAPRDPFVEQLGAVATALATADHEAVHTAAEELAGHPGLAPVAADLAAFARFQLRDFAAAGDLWAALIARLGDEAWPALQRRAAQARCWQAVGTKEPAAKAAAARLAITHADAALEADRTDVTARLARLSAYADLGRATRGMEGR